MRCSLRWPALLAAMLQFACTGSNTAANSPASETPAANGGSAGSGASPEAPDTTNEGAPVVSGLPLLPAEGIAQPAGTPGNLHILDWAGFKAAVTYTFDDSNRSQIKHYADLQALGVPMSFYLITSKPESTDPVWAQAVADGHEVANHTQTHQQMGTNLPEDTDAGQAFIETNLGIKVYTMAAPYGAAAYSDIARTRYLINRGVGDGQIAPNGSNDPFNLNCFIPPQAAPAATFNAKVDGVRSTGTWQVMLVHGFTDMDASEGVYQPIDFSEFVAGVSYAKAFGDVWIDSLVHVGAYWLGQKTLSAVTPNISGDTTTWTWTLPDHFPPNRYLRVTVDGGKLSQGGTPLAWNPHGYYEVALDAASLVLTP